MSIRAIITTESQEQAALISWWGHYSKSKGIDERLLLSIPNGANKSIATAMKFKREGLRKGAPDLFLAMPKLSKYPVQPTGWFPMLFNGLFIEMKRKGQKATPEQIAYGLMLRSRGYSSLICIGCDEAMQAIRSYIET